MSEANPIYHVFRIEDTTTDLSHAWDWPPTAITPPDPDDAYHALLIDAAEQALPALEAVQRLWPPYPNVDITAIDNLVKVLHACPQTNRRIADYA